MYKEVKREGVVVVETLGTKFKNLILVLGNAKFMIFLLIFSLFWIMFWQIFIIIPFYVSDYISKDAPFEIIQSADAWGIIALQLIVNRLTKHLPTRTAIVAGFAVSSVCWLVIAAHPTIWTIIAGLAVFSIGEMTQAPRYYESHLRPCAGRAARIIPGICVSSYCNSVVRRRPFRRMALCNIRAGSDQSYRRLVFPFCYRCRCNSSDGGL